MNLGPEVLLQLGILSIQDSLTSKFELADADSALTIVMTEAF